MVTFPSCIASKEKWKNIVDGIVYEQTMNYDKRTVQFSGRILKELCKFFGGKEGYKADAIFIHPFISSLPEKFIWSFLAGLFDSDGCLRTVTTRHNGSLRANLSYTSISQHMLRQMGVVLRTLGISNSLHRRKNDNKNGSIKIWENSAYLFLLKIYPHLYIKNEAAKYMLDGFNNKTLVYTGKSRNENYPVIDIIEEERKKQNITKQYLSQYIAANNGRYWAYTRINKGHTRKSYIPKNVLLKLNAILNIKEIDRIISGDEYFAVIKEIKINKYNGYVYDISTSTENFIANSFYSHNCTYIRSDSTFIVPEIISAMRDIIPTKYGDTYLPSKANVFFNKANAQEAHEAIRVTDLTIENVSGSDENKLYHIIWKRTMASQVANLIQFVGTAEFKCDKYIFGATGSKVIFEGWRKVWDYGSLLDTVLPEFVVGEELKFINVRTEQKFTTPPSRYTESSLTKELEKRGIGRPSTYAAIPDTLFSRGYIEKKKNTIFATEMGIRVSDFLVASDFCFVDLDFTSHLESDLDRIAKAEVNKLDILNHFWNRLKSDIVNATKKRDEDSKTNYKCKKCDGYLVKKFSKYGSFYSCENRSNKQNKCDYKCQIGENGEPIESPKIELEESSFLCSNCHSPLIKRTSKKGWQYLGCKNWHKDDNCKGFYDKETGKEIFFKKKKKWKKSNEQ
jgi:ssDNA-binding Zn-finger/Zn-ribbon topoisomerase 1